MKELPNHLSEPNFCSVCGKGEFTRVADSVTFSEVTWEDGLGSPGTLTHTYPQFRCNTCGHVNEAIYNGMYG
jgi:hypothetical protein